MHVAFLRGKQVKPKQMTYKQRVSQLSAYLTEKWNRKNALKADKEVEAMMAKGEINLNNKASL